MEVESKRVEVMAAVEMQQPLFEQMPYDGIVGLGLPGLTTETGCDFFARLTEVRFGQASGEVLGGWGASNHFRGKMKTSCGLTGELALIRGGHPPTEQLDNKSIVRSSYVCGYVFGFPLLQPDDPKKSSRGGAGCVFW